MGDTIWYYVIAQDSAGNIRSNNLYAEANDVNNITKHPLIPNSYKLVPVLASGTKLKVGLGQKFPTLTDTGGLFQYLNSVCLGGDITAVITSDLKEPGFFALKELGDIDSGTYKLIIRPDSSTLKERTVSGKIVLAGMIGLGMIRLDGADRVKFNGIPDFSGNTSDQKLRFINSSSKGSVFLFINGACDNHLQNLIIESADSLLLSGAVQYGESNLQDGNRRDTVSNCRIGNVSKSRIPSGIPANAIYSKGTPGKENSLNVIVGNEIFNWSRSGVGISSSGNGSNWLIENNSFYQNQMFPTADLQIAINIDAGLFSGGHSIRNNYIGGSIKNCGGSPWINNSNSGMRGISLSSGSFTLISTIQNNVIQNISKTNTGTSSYFYGIIVQNTAFANILNNQIGHPTNINSIGLSGNGLQSGIMHQSNTPNMLQNNRFYMHFSTLLLITRKIHI